MAQVSAQSAAPAPSREDFAKLVDESFSDGHLQEGAVVKGTVVAIERDVAVIDDLDFTGIRVPNPQE